MAWTPGSVRKFFIGKADPKLVARFALYHEAHPQVYVQFVKRALQARGRRPCYSQWTIIQSIRWDHDMATGGEPFKINNDYIALYVRMAIHDHPDKLRDFFELRRMIKTGRRMSGEEIKRRAAYVGA